MIENFSKEELETLYDEIMFKLTAPFPPNTVEFKNPRKPASAYIPSHAFQHRIRTDAGPYWSWRITTDKPIYHEETDEIEVRGVLTILHASAEGQGFATLDRYSDTKKIKFYKESVRAATSDALRDAADFFGIGWSDLAPYREWAKNPGAGLEKSGGSDDLKALHLPKQKVEVKRCKKCGAVLTQEDLDYLILVRWTNQVCMKDVPDHQKKKFDPHYGKVK
ncbi:hypothetical protein EHV15_34375 [Paenibacillus oralis]|uniref:Uncharacterized protein n=1 Tax=Paenibacillus oralis TaxID=2490856 RepID=A0A3P3T9H9_9BACL|nr:hypothetical protein [Paenibacillus oralis]RRJ54686.1 hypothetical protein EHV15_34375 [Paenibacillus oralis]